MATLRNLAKRRTNRLTGQLGAVVRELAGRATALAGGHQATRGESPSPGRSSTVIGTEVTAPSARPAR